MLRRLLATLLILIGTALAWVPGGCVVVERDDEPEAVEIDVDDWDD